MSKFSDKRSRVEGKNAGLGTFTLVAVLIAGVAVGATWWFLRSGNSAGSPAPSAKPAASKETSGAAPAVIKMTDIEANLDGGKIAVPLASVKGKGLVGFTYKGKQELPLLAYVAPSGKIVTAVSVCEPCSSKRFFIKDRRIVCQACYSQWDLETLKGITGGCLQYPPDQIPNSIDGANIIIDESAVAQWKPRI